MSYELAIIGGGPAGYSAGIYATRAGIKAVIFDKSGGGGLATSPQTLRTTLVLNLFLVWI